MTEESAVPFPTAVDSFNLCFSNSTRDRVMLSIVNAARDGRFSVDVDYGVYDAMSGFLRRMGYGVTATKIRKSEEDGRTIQWCAIDWSGGGDDE